MDISALAGSATTDMAQRGSGVGADVSARCYRVRAFLSMRCMRVMVPVSIPVVVFVVFVALLVCVGCSLKGILMERMCRSKEFEPIAAAQLRQPILVQLSHVFFLTFFKIDASQGMSAVGGFTLRHLAGLPVFELPLLPFKVTAQVVTVQKGLTSKNLKGNQQCQRTEHA